MKQKQLFIISIFVLVLIGIFFFFLKNNYKTTKTGNTKIDDIKEYILNLEAYEAEMEVEVCSNKNQNQYKIKQNYQAPGKSYQEILEPDHMKGLVTKYEDGKLTIENTKLNLSKIYENYPYIAENNLWLSGFIEDYKTSEKQIMKEEENEIILEAKKQRITKRLYIDKKTAKPTKLTIEDENQKMLIYILYKEIKIKSSR